MKTSLLNDWHIDHLKITHYRLNIAHKDGWAKAKAFLGFGFDPAQPDQFALALLEHALGRVPRTTEGRFGKWFVFEGLMSAPLGPIPRVRSVWLMRSGESSARLVTAYPFDER